MEAGQQWHLLPYAGQKGYVVAWVNGGAVGVKAHYKPGFDTCHEMGHLEAFREVRVLDTMESGLHVLER